MKILDDCFQEELYILYTKWNKKNRSLIGICEDYKLIEMKREHKKCVYYFEEDY